MSRLPRVGVAVLATMTLVGSACSDGTNNAAPSTSDTVPATSVRETSPPNTSPLEAPSVGGYFITSETDGWQWRVSLDPRVATVAQVDISGAPPGRAGLQLEACWKASCEDGLTSDESASISGADANRTAPELKFRGGVACWRASADLVAAAPPLGLSTTDDGHFCLQPIFNNIPSTNGADSGTEGDVNRLVAAASAVLAGPPDYIQFWLYEEGAMKFVLTVHNDGSHEVVDTQNGETCDTCISIG